MRQTSKSGQNFSRWDLEKAWQGNFGHNRKAWGYLQGIGINQSAGSSE